MKMRTWKDTQSDNFRNQTTGSSAPNTVSGIRAGVRRPQDFPWSGLLLELVQAAVIAIDTQGVVTHWNCYAERLYGWSREEAIGRRASELLVMPSGEALGRNIMAEVMASGTWEGDFTVQRRDGTTFPAHVIDTLIRDDGGRPVGFVGVSVDITERKRLEEERERLLAQEKAARERAEKAERRATHILDSITDGFYTLDREWRFTYLNAVAGRILEREPGSLLGKNIWEEFPEAVQAAFYTQFHEAMQDQVATTFEEYYRPLNKRGEIRVYPAGEEGLVVYVTDITERKRALEVLRESEARLRSAVTLAQLMRFEWDPQTGARRWDDSLKEIWGLPLHAEVTTQIFVEGVHPDDREMIREAIARSIDPTGDGLYNAEYRVVSRSHGQRRQAGDGGNEGDEDPVRWVSARGKTLFEGGVPVRQYGVAQDITERKRAEEGLSFLASIVESSDAAIIGKDPDGTIVSWNGGAERLYGYTEEEVKGRSISLLFPPERREELDFILRRMTAGERVYNVETVRVRKDGTPVDVALTASPIKDRRGKIIGASTIARDITERKRAVEAVRESEERLRRLIETNPDGVVMADRSGRITLANAAAERTLGLRRDEITARKYNDPAWKIAAVDGSPYSYEDLPVPRVLRTGQPVSGVEHSIERDDGTIATLSLNAAPLLDIRGEVVGVVATISDVTERKRAEGALSASEAQFRAVFVRSTDALFLLDDSSRITDANPSACTLTGVPRSTLIGLSFADFPGDDQYIPATHTWVRVLKQGEDTGEMRIERPDGQSRDIEFSCVANVLQGRHLAVVHDITERKAHQAQLEEEARARMELLQQLMTAQEAERRRLSMEIHDGPLQSLGVGLMALDRAKRRRERGEEDLADEELRNLRGTLGGTVNELRAILGDLSTEVLISKGLEAALRGHVGRYADVTGKSIELRYDVPPRLPDQLSLLYYRLAQEALANIRKHSQAERVDLSVEVECGVLQMNISDDGVGFDAEAVLREHVDGKQIGLRSMRERVRAVGGNMMISSAPGKGTTLRFWCPLPDMEPGLARLTVETLAVAGH